MDRRQLDSLTEECQEATPDDLYRWLQRRCAEYTKDRDMGFRGDCDGIAAIRDELRRRGLPAAASELGY